MMQTSEDIQELLTKLESSDGVERQEARELLVKIGSPVVPLLMEMLSRSTYWGRWEIVKTLNEIHAPSSAPVLVKALEDDNDGIRWLAAEGLSKIGRAALRPLMQALTRRADSIWLREGAHHVLHDMQKEELLHEQELKVYHALYDGAPDIEVPWIAEAALKGLAKE